HDVHRHQHQGRQDRHERHPQPGRGLGLPHAIASAPDSARRRSAMMVNETNPATRMSSTACAEASPTLLFAIETARISYAQLWVASPGPPLVRPRTTS